MTSPTHQRISDIVSKDDVVLFMKGTPYFPQCGFSSKAIAILEHTGVAFASVDVRHQRILRLADHPSALCEG